MTDVVCVAACGHVCSQIFGAVTLSKRYPPRAFRSVTPPPNTAVFEVCESYVTDTNPHGVGKDIGILTHPYGKHWGVHWGDGGDEALEKKFLRRAVQIHERFEIDGNLHECLRYDDELKCHCALVLPDAKNKAAADVKKNASRKTVAEKKKAAADAKKKAAADAAPKKDAVETTPVKYNAGIALKDHDAFAEFQRLSDLAADMRTNAERYDRLTSIRRTQTLHAHQCTQV